MSGSPGCEFREQPTVLPVRCKWLPTRYVFVFMGFLGFNMLYALRVNLSVAIVSMVVSTQVTGKTSDHFPGQCLPNNSQSEMSPAQDHERVDRGEFEWDATTQGVVLGSFFWGYIVTQIPGGLLAEKFGSKSLLGYSILFTSLLTIISPLMARYHYVAFMVCRALEGMFEGFAFPSMHAMIARWLPINERGLGSTFIYSGAQIGTVITMPLAGFLCSSTALGGWPTVFYVLGIAGCLWYAAWTLFVYETPQEHPHISAKELQYIVVGQGAEQTQRNPRIPWRAVLTSVPLWALVFTHFGQNWGFYTLLFQLPTYFSSILGFDLKNNGLLSALPYLLQAMVGWSVGFLFDYLIRNRLLEVNTIRKLSNTIGFLGPAFCLYLVTIARCDATLSVILFIFALGFNGHVYSGYNVTHVDMAPDFAGTLMGITNCFANFAGVLAPYVVGLLTKDEVSLERWAYIFYISSLVYCVSALVFVVFGSAKLQNWGIARCDPSLAISLENQPIRKNSSNVFISPPKEKAYHLKPRTATSQ